jgi:hypothetical protein
MELNPRSKRDLTKFLNILSQQNQRCEKIVLNGFGTNAYENDLYRDQEFINVLFSDKRPVVVSPRKSELLTVSIEQQILKIKQWSNEGKRIVLNTDDHFRETNKYGNYNTILEDAFVLYDKSFWVRQQFPHWTKDDIVLFMKYGQAISRNIEINTVNIANRYQNIINDDKF